MLISKHVFLACLLCLNVGLSAGASVPLEQAIQENRPDQIIELLTTGLAPDTRVEEEGEELSLLAWSLFHGHHDLGKRLLDAGVSPNETFEGIPLTDLALKYREYVFLSMLLDKGADPNQIRQGFSLLQRVVKQNAPIDVFKALLEKKPDLEYTSQKGDTALMLASAFGNFEQVKLLLAQGASLKTRNVLHMSALDLAIAYGHRTTAKLLLDTEPSLLGEGEDAFTQLKMSLGKNPVLFRDLLTRRGQPLDAALASRLLPWAILSKNIANVRRILAAGADPERLEVFPDENAPGYALSPLSFAIVTQQHAIVSLLLEAGADPARSPVLALAAQAAYSPSDANWKLFEQLLQRGANPHQADPAGRTALMALARNGAYPLIEKLLARGVQVNARDAEGNTALLELLKNYNIDGDNKRSLIALLRQGADVQLANREGGTPLMFAVGRGDPGAFALILSKRPRLDAQDASGQTALHVAIWNQRPAQFTELLKRGSNPNLTDKQGLSPLMAAAAEGQSVQAGQLLDHGARLTLRDHQGRWAYDYAFTLPQKLLEATRQPDTDYENTAQLAVRRLLLSRVKSAAELKGLFSLALETRYGSPELARELVRKGAEPNRPEPAGMTPLMAAAGRGESALVDALLQKGAQPQASLNGLSVLHYAVGSGKSEVVKLLLAKGVDLRKQTSGGSPLLIAAAESGSLEMVRLLLQKGASLSWRSPSGDSAWLAAARSGNVALLTFLHAQGAKPSEQDKLGLTALHAAAARGHLDAITWLLKHGAVLETRNHLGRTPLMLAVINQALQSAELLMHRGADPQSRDLDGHNAKDYAGTHPFFIELFGK